MKTLFNTGILLLLLSVFAQTLKAQNAFGRGSDFIVPANTNDTVFCDIKTNLSQQNPKYKINQKGAKYEKITPLNVRSYYTYWNDKLYTLILTRENTEGFFATVVEQGKINLYEVSYTSPGYFNGTYVTGSTKNVTWYISKGSNSAEPLKFNSLLTTDREKRKDLLEEMIADNKEVADKYATSNKKFTFSHISNLVHLYNTGEWLGK